MSRNFYTINPLTGRKIQIGGTRYNELVGGGYLNPTLNQCGGAQKKVSHRVIDLSNLDEEDKEFLERALAGFRDVPNVMTHGRELSNILEGQSRKGILDVYVISEKGRFSKRWEDKGGMLVLVDPEGRKDSYKIILMNTVDIKPGKYGEVISPSKKKFRYAKELLDVMKQEIRERGKKASVSTEFAPVKLRRLWQGNGFTPWMKGRVFSTTLKP